MKFKVEGITLCIELKNGFMRVLCKEIDATFVGYSETLSKFTIGDINTVAFVRDYTVLLVDFYTKNHETACIKLCSSSRFNAYREIKYMQNSYNANYEVGDVDNSIYKTFLDDMNKVYKKSIIKNKEQQEKIKKYILNKQKDAHKIFLLAKERNDLRIECDDLRNESRQLRNECAELENQVAELAGKLAELNST